MDAAACRRFRQRRRMIGALRRVPLARSPCLPPDRISHHWHSGHSLPKRSDGTWNQPREAAFAPGRRLASRRSAATNVPMRQRQNLKNAAAAADDTAFILRPSSVPLFCCTFGAVSEHPGTAPERTQSTAVSWANCKSTGIAAWGEMMRSRVPAVTGRKAAWRKAIGVGLPVANQKRIRHPSHYSGPGALVGARRSDEKAALSPATSQEAKSSTKWCSPELI